MRALPFFIVLTLPVLVLLGVELGGGWAFLGAVAVYGGVPFLDALGGLERSNPDDPGPAWLYDVPLVLWLPSQLAVTGWVLWRVASGDGGWLELIGATVSLGAINGAGGINVAHELMHRTSRASRALAEVILYAVSYPHFAVEHVLGHHRRVATPLDSATSRQGEAVYVFVLRSVARSLTSAWRLERDRAVKRGQAWGPRDRRLRYPLVQVAVWAGVGLLLGPLALLVFFGQSAVAITILEIINYIEHYGLQRREVAPGRYERVQPHHSWNAAHRFSNWLLLNLERHSDHHFLASRPYRLLRHHEDVPQLPAGYATMLLLALVPPLWRRVMDPRVEAWRVREAQLQLAA